MAPPIPPPTDLAARPDILVGELEQHIGTGRSARYCAGLLQGADPEDEPDLFVYLGARATERFLAGTWGPPYWSRVWGARGLRYVWTDECAPAVVDGLGDDAWRVAEMCVKVSGQREIGEAGPGAAALAGHELPRVRQAVIRTLGRIGDTEHVVIVEAALDDEEPAVRKVAARSLDQLRSRLDLG